MPGRHPSTWGLALLLALAGCGPATVTAEGGGGGGRPGSPLAVDGSSVGLDLAVPVVPDAAVGETGGISAPGQGQACARENVAAQLTPVDLLLLLDTSGSMAEKAGTRSRLELANEALVSFIKDGRSTGLGVGLQIFPQHRSCPDDGTCFLPSPGGCRVLSVCLAPKASLASGVACDGPGDDPCPAGTTCTPLGRCSISGGDCAVMGQPCASGVAGDMCGVRPRQCRLGPSVRGTCTVADYQKVMVPIADLPGAAVRLTGAIETRVPIGGTPMAPALKGALAYLTERQMTSPERRAVLVLISDGVPEGCGDVPGIVTDMMAASARPQPISTYVVGVFADSDPPAGRAAVTQFATAGGTGTPFIISANEQLAEKFLAALTQIRGAALSCDLAIPRPSAGQIDFAKVNVQVNGSAGARDLTYVERRDRCDTVPDGWYYDVPPAGGATPARVVLCPAACDKLKADPKGAIDLVFGCRSRTVD